MNSENKNVSVNEPEKTEKSKKSKPTVSLRILKYVTAFVVLVTIIYFGFTCEVREGNCAVILRFGAPRAEITEAGLYFRLPWPFETVVSYDSRLQYLESNYLETLTNDKRNVIVQSYVVWKVNDPLLYHNSVGTRGTADSYIKDQVSNATNSVMSAYTLSSLVSLEKETIKTDEIQSRIFETVRDNCVKNYGIAVTDVSILRLSLPDTNLQSVFEQMKAERQSAIDTIIANATRDAENRKSDADKEASAIIKAGEDEARRIETETNTAVAKIYDEAKEANRDLYNFLKNLDAVVASVNESTVLIVKADEYPFNVLTEYGNMLTDESNETIIKDLSYILTQLPEKERTDLVTAISQLIAEAGGTAE